MILRSPLPDLVIPDVTFSEYILNHLQSYGNEIAMIEADENGRTTTYRQLHDSTRLCAAALNKLGVTTGDVVAVCLGNRREFLIVVLATAACGAILTTCNPSYTEGEVTKQFSHFQPKLVFAENNGYQIMKAVAKRVCSIKNVFTVTPVQGSTSLEELLSMANLADYPFDRNPEKREVPFYLPYSSGTTGLPKGVMLSHHNLMTSILITCAVFRSSKKDCYYLVLPLFHIYGTIMSFRCLAQGIKLVLQQRFTVQGLLESIQKYKVTEVAAVPPMILAVYNSPLLSSYDTSSLEKVLCGAAPLPEVVGEEVKKKLNVNMVQGWGLTEAVPLTATIDTLTPLRSIGRVAPNTLVKFVDVDTGRELNTNETGEICVKGPQVMKGYFKNPGATANTIDVDGWFHTGDIGYFDEFEQIYIVDRLKELIKVKGFQVAPAELEDLLLRHPNVTDAAVIGVPNVESGEVPKAFLVTNDKGIRESEIHRYLKGQVSSYKYLKGGVVFRDVIPKSASGKILRRQLRDEEAKSRL